VIAKQKGWICALMDDRRDAENEKTGSRNEKRKSGQLDASSFPSSPSARLFLLVYKPRPFHHPSPPCARGASTAIALRAARLCGPSFLPQKRGLEQLRFARRVS